MHVRIGDCKHPAKACYEKAQASRAIKTLTAQLSFPCSSTGFVNSGKTAIQKMCTAQRSMG